MHRYILLLTGAALYYILATWALYSFEAGLLVSSIIFFGIPSYFFAHYSAAPTAVIVSVSTFAVGIAITLEGVAHLYGLWYVPGLNDLRLFDLVPVEMVVAASLKILFLTLLYEFLFDDRQYSLSNARKRFAGFGIFAVGTLILLATHYVIFKSFLFPNAYYWITVLLVLASLSMISFYKTLTLRLFDKLALFASLAALPLFINEVLAKVNGHKLYESVYQPVEIPFFESATLPLGELLLVFSLPFFVATIYELYIDDRM